MGLEVIVKLVVVVPGLRSRRRMIVFMTICVRVRSGCRSVVIVRLCGVRMRKGVQKAEPRR